jgi:hypothetical protein
MPKMKRINSSNEKKLDLTPYFKDCLEEGETEVYIYIKKLPYEIKRKIDFLAFETFDSKKQSEMLKKLKENGYTLKDLNNPKKQLGIIQATAVSFQDMGLDNKSASELFDFTNKMEVIILENGVDHNKHNFKDENDTNVDLDYTFWRTIGNDELTLYVLDQIKVFSKGFSLGK